MLFGNKISSRRKYNNDELILNELNNTSLFEIGPQFSGENPDDENIVAAGIRSQQAKNCRYFRKL